MTVHSTSQHDRSFNRSATIQNLRDGLSRFQNNLRLVSGDDTVVSTGIAELDGILPDRGLLRGGLSEWIAAEPGSGATSLAMRMAGRAQQKGPLIIIDGLKQFYPPAFVTVGVCLDNTILVRPESRNDQLWAVEQALRCRSIGAVLCRIDHLRTSEFRRLQLAAEAGTAIGLLVRPSVARRQSGWADVRLLVTPRPSLPNSFHRRLSVRCVYAKGGITDQTLKLDVCDETGTVRVAAGVSDSAAVRRAAGA